MMAPLMVSVPSSALRLAVPSKSTPAVDRAEAVEGLAGVGGEQAGAGDRAAVDRVGVVAVVAAGEPERFGGRVDVDDAADVDAGGRPHVAGDVDRAVEIHVAAGQQRGRGVVVHQVHHARAVERPLGVGSSRLTVSTPVPTLLLMSSVLIPPPPLTLPKLLIVAALIVSGASMLTKSPTASVPSRSTVPPTMLSVTASLTLAPS